MKRTVSAFSLLMLLAACGTPSSQRQYLESDVGVSRIVEFGTVLSYRFIDITGQNTGAGGFAGGALGAAAGSGVGSGSGNATATVGAAIAGALVGAAIEQANRDREGVEYTIMKENGKVVSIAQNLAEGDELFIKGARVMIQTSGSYQRVLSAEALPEQVQRPKGINVTD